MAVGGSRGGEINSEYRQQNKTINGTNNNKTSHRKPSTEKEKSNQTLGVNDGAPEGFAIPASICDT